MVSSQVKISKAIKVFIDSSVLIAAAISSKGSARDLITKALRNELKVVISDLVIEETQRNLSNKAPKALPSLQLFLEALNPEVTTPSKSLVTKVARVVERKDAPIVAGAISSKSDYLVSYDQKHLLKQKQIIKINFKIKIVTPDEMVK
ncbi:MAG: putative toxin-antitoxin system toxin component, PIN family [Patescibacteria group bacterium]